MDRPADSDAPLDERLAKELPALESHLRRLLAPHGRAGEAADLAQEAAARALRYRHAFDPRRALGPWLRRLAGRLTLATRAGGPTTETAPEPAAVVPDRAAEAEELELLLSVLSEVERASLLAFHRDGDSLRVIARRLALPVGTVKSHLHRARTKLAAEAARLRAREEPRP